MATKHPEIFKALAAPILDEDIAQRPDGRGGHLKYITARVAMNRLDNVLGPENWKFDLKPWGNDLIGTLTITLPDGTTTSKSDVGGRAGMPKTDDDAKSASSDCLKRCAALFGIARELYGDGVAEFVEQAPPQKQKNDWPTAHRGPTRPERSGNDGAKPFGAPKTGGQLFAWAKRQEEEHGVGIIKYLDGWGRLQDFPNKWKDWDAEQVTLGYAEACNKLETVGASN